ncbi:MAG: type II secretion system protein [Kiritimatiellia bacterium]
MKHKLNGFTLIELLVVVAIIGLLVAVLSPAIRSAISRGRAATCQSNVRKNSMILLDIARDNGGWLTVFRDGSGGFDERIFHMIGDRFYEGQDRPVYTPELVKSMHCPEMPAPKTPFLECYGVNFASNPGINAAWTITTQFGANLGSLRLDAISSPAQFPVLMDSLGMDGKETHRVNHSTNYPALRHNRQCNSSFADGHAAGVPLAELSPYLITKAYLWRSQGDFSPQSVPAP